MSEFEWTPLDDEQVRATVDHARQTVEFMIAALVTGARSQALTFCHPAVHDRWVLSIDDLAELLTERADIGIGSRAYSVAQYPDRRYYTVVHGVDTARGRNYQDNDLLIGVKFHYETGRWLVIEARTRDGAQIIA